MKNVQVKAHERGMKAVSSVFKKVKMAGGFSKAVYLNPRFQNYINSGYGVAGYIGAYNRTEKIDKFVEEFLREEGLNDTEIAIWLTSTSGRHMMDDVDKRMTIAQFAQRASGSLKDAKNDLIRWGDKQ